MEHLSNVYALLICRVEFQAGLVDLALVPLNKSGENASMAPDLGRSHPINAAVDGTNGGGSSGQRSCCAGASPPPVLNLTKSLNVGHDGRADISLRAGIYKDRANKANVKIGRENAILPLHESGQRKCHITST